MILTLENKIDIENLHSSFQEEKDKETIFPEFISDYDFGYWARRDENLCMRACFQSNKLKAISIYDSYMVDDRDDLKHFLQGKLHLKITPEDDKMIEHFEYGKKIAYVRKLESFDKNRGYGSAILDDFKSDESINGIFLESLKNSRRFYEKNDFALLKGAFYSDRIYCWLKTKDL